MRLFRKCAALILTACAACNYEPQYEFPEHGHLSAFVDGKKWTADYVLSHVAGDSIIQVGAHSREDPYNEFLTINFRLVGATPFSDSLVENMCFYGPPRSKNDQYFRSLANSGIVTIDELDYVGLSVTKIRGTFNFRAALDSDTIDITDGTFDLGL